MPISLAETYAHALHEIEKKSAAPGTAVRFVSAVKSRGHGKLLPQILARYEQLKENGAKGGVQVRIASERERAGAEKTAEKEGVRGIATLRIDRALVSGFSLQGRDFRIDHSGRRALLELFNKMTA